MRPLLSLIGWIFLAFVAVNVMYEVKCLMDIDLLPGHYGNLFPLKDWVKEVLTDEVDNSSSHHSEDKDRSASDDAFTSRELSGDE